MATTSFYLSMEQHYRKLLQAAIETQRTEICAGLLDHDRYKYSAGILQGIRQAEALFEKALKETMHN